MPPSRHQKPLELVSINYRYAIALNGDALRLKQSWANLSAQRHHSHPGSLAIRHLSGTVRMKPFSAISVTDITACLSDATEACFQALARQTTRFSRHVAPGAWDRQTRMVDRCMAKIGRSQRRISAVWLPPATKSPPHT